MPEARWPLFLRSHHWLRLLDGTVSERRRFFRDEERAAAAASSSGWDAEQGGLSALPLFDEADDEDEAGEWGTAGEADEVEAGGRPAVRRPGRTLCPLSA